MIICAKDRETAKEYFKSKYGYYPNKIFQISKKPTHGLLLFLIKEEVR